MLPIISGREGDLIKIEVTINLSGSMLEAEESRSGPLRLVKR
jgi:hypothetical protein